jgi:hypothetical protein
VVRQAVVRTSTSSVFVLHRLGLSAARSETRPADGAVGCPGGFAASRVALERAPLAMFGIRVFDTDTVRGLAALHLAPAIPLGQRGVVIARLLGLPWRGRGLPGKLVRESALAAAIPSVRGRVGRPRRKPTRCSPTAATTTRPGTTAASCRPLPRRGTRRGTKLGTYRWMIERSLVAARLLAPADPLGTPSRIHKAFLNLTAA